MKLYGREWTRRELEARVGRVEQIGGIRMREGVEGKEKGMSFIEVRTGAGLAFTVVPSKGLDLSHVEYGGTPISWMSPSGDVHPMFYDGRGTGWLASASGGMLMTCGLTNVGSPSALNGVEHGIHGKVHHTPARQVSATGEWNGDEYEMTIRGIVEEMALFGPTLRMKREIRCRLGDNRIRICDTVENIGFEAAPHMLLYHFNFGFPFLDDNTGIHIPSESVSPVRAEVPVEGWNVFEKPIQGYEERVYDHDMGTGDRAEVALTQPHFPQACGREVPLTASIGWSADTLPRLVQWKLPAAGTYVLGIEPANCGVEGIAAEQDKGTLVWLPPGEKRIYHLELDFKAGS